MSRPALLTPEHVAEIVRRRRAGEPWKAIRRDLAARGLPASRTRLWAVWLAARGVSEHLRACDPPGNPTTPSA
jgi:hypothetical protein